MTKINEKRRQTEKFIQVDLYVLEKQLRSVFLGIWRTATEKKSNRGKRKKTTKFCDIILSQPKKHKLLKKTIKRSKYVFL